MSLVVVDSKLKWQGRNDGRIFDVNVPILIKTISTRKIGNMDNGIRGNLRNVSPSG